MIRTIVSGGQSGADLGGWEAAKTAGLHTAGYMPRDYMTEDGPKPEYADIYNADECQSPHYPERTRLNVLHSDALLWFGNPSSNGGRLTLRIASDFGRPIYLFEAGYASDEKIKQTAHALRMKLIGTLRAVMVAGNRESISPGIRETTRTNCLRLFSVMRALDSRR